MFFQNKEAFAFADSDDELEKSSFLETSPTRPRTKREVRANDDQDEQSEDSSSSADDDTEKSQDGSKTAVKKKISMVKTVAGKQSAKAMNRRATENDGSESDLEENSELENAEESGVNGGEESDSDAMDLDEEHDDTDDSEAEAEEKDGTEADEFGDISFTHHSEKLLFRKLRKEC